MAELQTKQNDGDVDVFLASVSDPKRRADAQQLCALLRSITGVEPRLWGPSIVGFGSYHYRYATGREGDWFPVGFSPRKSDLTLYLLHDFPEREALLARLGPHRTGKSCLYVKGLERVDLAVLKELLTRAYQAGGSGETT